jgi:recombination protein RecA
MHEQTPSHLNIQGVFMDTQVKGSSISNPNSEKAKALQAALAQIEKQFGKGTIMRLGEGEVIEDIQVVSTGSLGLDIALGVGGLPRGRVIEIYGPESSGKTTLTLQVIAEMQKMGGQCAFVDAEHALDIQYAQKLGVNLQDLLISQSDTGELGGGGSDCGGFGRGADAQSRTRRRDGRFPARPAG